MSAIAEERSKHRFASRRNMVVACIVYVALSMAATFVTEKVFNPFWFKYDIYGRMTHYWNSAGRR